MYFFRREKVQCRYQFSLRDAVDLTLLQRALTTALASAPYYTQRLVQEKREMWLEPNTEPCLVYHGSTMRNIPEETNGYLFCVSCEGDTVYFDWHHFLLDGHGVSPLFTSILEQYCNLRYGTAFAVQQIVCDPPYDMDAMLAEHPPVEGGSKKMCRAVGNALHKNPNPDEIPCYRVVNAKGELSGAFAFGGAGEQAKRLRADGIEVIDGRVDLDKYGIRIVDDVIYTKTTVEPLT